MKRKKIYMTTIRKIPSISDAKALANQLKKNLETIANNLPKSCSQEGEHELNMILLEVSGLEDELTRWYNAEYLRALGEAKREEINAENNDRGIR